MVCTKSKDRSVGTNWPCERKVIVTCNSLEDLSNNIPSIRPAPRQSPWNISFLQKTQIKVGLGDWPDRLEKCGPGVRCELTSSIHCLNHENNTKTAKPVTC